MAGTVNESGLALPHALDSIGYEVRICRHCKGWGYVSGPDPFTDEMESDLCEWCNGTGRVAVRPKLEAHTLNDVLIPFKQH